MKELEATSSWEGAVEMDALVAGALRMLRGQEELRDYDTERND